MGKEKALENIILGLERFFDKRFPPENIDIKPLPNLDEHTYSMQYKGNHYFLCFDSDNNFDIEIELNKNDERMSQKLEVYRTPNEKLNKTKYLRDQDIKFADNKININCKIDRYPTNDKETNEFCDHLWQYVIKNVMLSVS